MNASDECSENIKILERGFAAYLEEYREQADIWKTLETKAQAVTTVAGLFLAAAFAFSREPTLATPIKLAVLAAIVSLFLAVLAALAVLRAVEFQLPDGGNAASAARAAVSASARPCGEPYQAYLSDQLEGAEQILTSLEAVNKVKQERLAAAQALVALAALLSVLSTAAHMFVPRAIW
jgi:hypothetical protein